jgi:surface glycoprotein (TIGR04207 family)/PGF-CTERM protein
MIRNKRTRALFLSALMVLSVFGGAIALMGTAAATTPTIESVVEFNAPEDGSQGDIEVVFNTNVEPQNGGDFVVGENVTVTVNGEDVSDRFVVASQPDDGRMVLWSGTDILPSDDFSVTVENVADTDTSDSASQVSADGEATASTLNVDADNVPSQTEFQGAPIALNFPNQGQNVFYEVENADSGSTVIGPLATGPNSQNAVLETGSLAATSFNVLVDTNGDEFGDTVGATFNIREFSLTTSLTTQGPIFSNESIEGTVTAGVANRIVDLSLVNDNTGETVDTDEISLNSQGEGTFSFPGASTQGNEAYFVEAQDAQSGVTNETGVIQVDPRPTADGSLDEVDNAISRSETAEFNISFDNVDELNPVGYLVLEDTGEGLDYTANITVRDDPDTDSNAGAVVLDTGVNGGFSAIGGIILENVEVDAEGAFDEISNGEYDVRFNDTALDSAYNEVGATETDSFTVNANDQGYAIDNAGAVNDNGFAQDGTANVEVSFTDTNASRAHLSVGGQGSGYELNVTVRDEPGTDQSDGTISIDLGANDVSVSGGLELVHAETTNTPAVNTEHAVRLDQGTRTDVFNQGPAATLFVANTDANYAVTSGLDDTILTNETVQYDVSFADTNNSQAWLVIDNPDSGFEAVLNVEDDPTSAESSGTITVDTSGIGTGNAANIFSTSGGLAIDSSAVVSGTDSVDATSYDVNFSVLSASQATSAPDDTGTLTARHFILENPSFDVEQGDLARFDVRFEDGFDREAYLTIGDVGDGSLGYEVNITITDAPGGDGTGTVVFNTYEAGQFTGNVPEVTASGGITVDFTQTNIISGNIFAGDYGVQFDTSSRAATYTDARTTGTLNVVPRSGDVSVNTWTAPADDLGNLQGATAQEIQEFAENGTLTDRDRIAINQQFVGGFDTLVYQIQAPGIQGFLETQGGTTGGMIAADALSLVQENPTGAQAPKELILSESAAGISVKYDAASNTYFVVADVDSLDLKRDANQGIIDAMGPFPGESYGVEFTVNDNLGTQSATTDPTEFFSAPIELRASSLSDGTYEILLREEVFVFGSTELAPGTEFEMNLVEDNGNTLLPATDPPTVADDGSFEAFFNFTAAQNTNLPPAGTTGTIQLDGGTGFDVLADFEFRIQPIANVNIEDQTSIGGELVRVESGQLSEGGFVVIHEGGPGGPIVGHSKLLPSGSFTDLPVPLDEPISENATLVAMPHFDDPDSQANPVGIFNFSAAEGQDLPYRFSEEVPFDEISGSPAPVTDSAEITFLPEDQIEITRTVIVNNTVTRTVEVPVDVTRTVTVPVTRTVEVPVEVTRTVIRDRTVEVTRTVTRTVEVVEEVTRTVTRTVEVVEEVTRTVEVTRTIINEEEVTRTVTIIRNITDTSGQPGLGALVAVIALLAASLLAARRRDW